MDGPRWVIISTSKVRKGWLCFGQSATATCLMLIGLVQFHVDQSVQLDINSGVSKGRLVGWSWFVPHGCHLMVRLSDLGSRCIVYKGMLSYLFYLFRSLSASSPSENSPLLCALSLSLASMALFRSSPPFFWLVFLSLPLFWPLSFSILLVFSFFFPSFFYC